MPYGGLMTFPHSIKKTSDIDEEGVNALWRAYDFSTVTSWKPHKQGVPEAIFDNNSQNILKISIFRAFFVISHFFGSFPGNLLRKYYIHFCDHPAHPNVASYFSSVSFSGRSHDLCALKSLYYCYLTISISFFSIAIIIASTSCLPSLKHRKP